MPDLRVTFPSPCGERWEGMTPTGCHRTCAKCEKVVHDLSQYNVAQVENLLRVEPDSCFRARVDAFGVAATRPELNCGIRRIATAVGVSAGLLISAPVLSRGKNVEGSIAGTVQTSGWRTKVTAKDENGNSFRAKVKANGTYKIKNVPSGTYTLEISGCGSWTLEGVVVDQGETLAPDPSKDDPCIVVGLMKINAVSEES